MPKGIGLLDRAPRLGAHKLAIPSIDRSFAKASITTEVSLQVGKLSSNPTSARETSFSLLLSL